MFQWVSRLQDDTLNATDQQLWVTEEARGFHTEKKKKKYADFHKLILEIAVERLFCVHFLLSFRFDLVCRVNFSCKKQIFSQLLTLK